MTAAVCPCCGQDIPGDEGVLNYVTGPQRHAFIDVLLRRKAGMTAEALFDALYAHRPDGGPEQGLKIISVFACQINKQLRENGAPYQIKAWDWNPRRYHLVRTERAE